MKRHDIPVHPKAAILSGLDVIYANEPAEAWAHVRHAVEDGEITNLSIASNRVSKALKLAKESYG